MNKYWEVLLTNKGLEAEWGRIRDADVIVGTRRISWVTSENAGVLKRVVGMEESAIGCRER